MLFLHIVPPSKRMMNTYFRMLREHFPLEEHRFLFIDQCKESESELFNYENVAELQGENSKEKLKDFFRECDQADVVLWHGIMYGAKKMLPLFYSRKLRKKSVWIMRGLDLYNWKCETKFSLRYRLINGMNYFIRKHLPYVVAIIPTDEEVYHKQFGYRAKCTCVAYPFSKDAFNAMDHFDAQKKRDNGETFILIGNNAYTFNRHLEALESLSSFAEESLKLYIPLSYGNDWYDKEKDYKYKVHQYADETFGSEKVEVLYKLLETEQYTNLLMNMDVAIIASNRQNALGNIHRLLYVGNKVYLNKDNPMYQYFLSEGIDIYDMDTIADSSYDEFIKKADKKRNSAWIKEHHHPDFQYKKWGELFTDLAHYIAKDSQYENGGHEISDDQKTEEYIARRKSNYLCVERGQYLPKGSVYYDIEDVFVVGSDDFEYTMIQWMEEENQVKKRWFIQGIIDDKERNKKCPFIKQDIIADISEFTSEFVPDAVTIVAEENADKRREIVKKLDGRVCEYTRFAHPSASVQLTEEIAEGTIFYPGAIVDITARIGAFTYVKNAVIKSHVQIGEYCNIGHYAVIGQGVVIGSHVTIGDHVVIKDRVVISDHTVLEAGQIIKENI